MLNGDSDDDGCSSFRICQLQDVRQILIAQQMQRVIDEYDKTGMIVKNKHVMVQILVSHMITSCNTL